MEQECYMCMMCGLEADEDTFCPNCHFPLKKVSIE